jgi:hypothetical protein
MNDKPIKSTDAARAATLLCVGLAALVIGSAARGETGASSVTFTLKEKHDSGISGTATLTAAGTGVRVVLRLKGRLRGMHFAHIHTGPCRREPTFANPRIWLSLANVQRGKSVTTLDKATVGQFRARTYSINVHDPNSLGVVACGDIPPAK